MERKIRVISGILFCLYISAVGVLCLIKTDTMPDIERFFLGLPADKVAHFLMFTPFSMLAGLTFIKEQRSGIGTFLILAAILIAGSLTAYGTERLQAATGYRSYDITDFYADLYGLCFGTALTLIYILLRNRKK